MGREGTRQYIARSALKELDPSWFSEPHSTYKYTEQLNRQAVELLFLSDEQVDQGWGIFFQSEGHLSAPGGRMLRVGWTRGKNGQSIGCLICYLYTVGYSFRDTRLLHTLTPLYAGKQEALSQLLEEGMEQGQSSEL